MAGFRNAREAVAALRVEGSEGEADVGVPGSPVDSEREGDISCSIRSPRLGDRMLLRW